MTLIVAFQNFVNSSKNNSRCTNLQVGCSTTLHIPPGHFIFNITCCHGTPFLAPVFTKQKGDFQQEKMLSMRMGNFNLPK